MEFSDDQMRAVETTERVCSVLSLLGTAFIITTFLCSKSFHKPINRLVFFAAWGNIMSNIATLISISGIRLGVDSSLCQFQAFLIQWFMPADALWTFAMACNVYLTFFRQYEVKQLRLLEWKYILFCYGTPFIPAFAYCFVKSESHGKVYGSAVLWCWVSLDWDFLRVATFYGPVWVMIFATFAIYLSAGRIMLQWRRQLLNYAQNYTNDIPISSQSQSTSPGIVKRTELYVTSKPAQISNTDRLLGFESTQTPLSPQPKPYSTHHDRNLRPSFVRTDANSAAINYFKCALLFFIALLVTWVPSTANRVVTLVHPDDAIFGLNYTSGLVLPLQGFWNAIIYIFASFPACKALMRNTTTVLHMDQMPLQWNGQFSTTADARGCCGRRYKKQSASRSESVQELHRNSEGGRTTIEH